MKRVFILSGLLLFALLSVPTVQAQTPDLSGTWVYNPDKSVLPNTERMGARGGGTEIVIKQEGDTITITRQMRTREGTRSMDEVIVADGQPHEQSMGRGTVTVTASWQEGKLVVERTMPSRRGQGSATTSTTTYTVRNDGQLLLIDSTDRQGDLISRAYDRKG